MGGGRVTLGVTTKQGAVSVNTVFGSLCLPATPTTEHPLQGSAQEPRGQNDPSRGHHQPVSSLFQCLSGPVNRLTKATEVLHEPGSTGFLSLHWIWLLCCQIPNLSAADTALSVQYAITSRGDQSATGFATLITLDHFCPRGSRNLLLSGLTRTLGMICLPPTLPHRAA